MKTTKIKGKEIIITKFGAKQGWRLIHKLSSIFGPAMASMGVGKVEEAFSAVFEKMDEDSFISLIEELISVTQIDGRNADFNVDCSDYAFTMELITHVVKENFEEFFLKLADSLGGAFGSTTGT